MDTAYVLGNRQYGYWVKDKPDELSIHTLPHNQFMGENSLGEESIRVQLKEDGRDLPEPTGAM